MPAPPASTAARPAIARSYPGALDQIRLIRTDLRDLLAGCPRADDIVLCASELAANAAIHSSSALPGGTITIRADICAGCHVRIEVSDNGGSWPAWRRHPARDPERPHGLDVISALAATWGIEDTPAGHAVWACMHWEA